MSNGEVSARQRARSAQAKPEMTVTVVLSPGRYISKHALSNKHQNEIFLPAPCTLLNFWSRAPFDCFLLFASEPAAIRLLSSAYPDRITAHS